MDPKDFIVLCAFFQHEAGDRDDVSFKRFSFAHIECDDMHIYFLCLCRFFYRPKEKHEEKIETEKGRLDTTKDYWRKEIVDGDTSSAPRDWFESTIDYLIEKVSENYKPREFTDDEILEEAKLSLGDEIDIDDVWILLFARSLLLKASKR